MVKDDKLRMEMLAELKKKKTLDTSDARLVLQFIQQLTSPILSIRSCTSTITTAQVKSEKMQRSLPKVQGSLDIRSLKDFPALTIQSRYLIQH